jgi:hypothetical protein
MTPAKEQDCCRSLGDRSGKPRLQPRVRNTCFDFFEEIEPVEPPLRPFSDIELALIQNIDRKAPVA